MSSGSGEEYWQLFVTSYGPIKTLAATLDDARREEFHRPGSTSSSTNYRDGDTIEHPREYLLVTGTRK